MCKSVFKILKISRNGTKRRFIFKDFQNFLILFFIVFVFYFTKRAHLDTHSIKEGQNGLKMNNRNNFMIRGGGRRFSGLQTFLCLNSHTCHALHMYGMAR